MADRFRFADGPARETLTYLEGKTASPSYHWLDLYGEEHAFAFTVAKAEQVAVLSALHEAVEAAISKGLTKEAFKAGLVPELKRLGWWGKATATDPLTGETERVQLGSPRRLDIIYWANTRTAHAAGKWTRFQRTKADLPFLLYRLGPAREHRPHHASKENIILPIDDPFWNIWFPPNGWGCVCWVRQLTADEAKQLGGESPAPAIPMRSFVNKRTGERREIPEGIDPGWDSNPGKARHRTLAAHLAGKLEAAPEHIRKAAVVDLIGSQMFRRVQSGALADRKIFTPVAVLTETVADAVGASTRTALLSTDDAAKQLRKRAAFDVRTYELVQRLLDEGEIRRDMSTHNANDFAATALIDGKWWRALFRVTRDGREIFLKSFRRTNADQVQQYEARGPRLRPEPERRD